MGAKPSAEIMDILTKGLAGLPGYSKEVPPHKNIQTHVDNIRALFDNFEDAEHYSRWLEDRAEACGVTFNSDELGVHTQGPFCGMFCDYEVKSVCLLPKILRKIERWRSHLASEKPLCAGDIAEMFGVLFYSSSVLRCNLATFYFAIKAYRRVCSRLSKGTVLESEEVSFSSRSRTDVIEWLDSLAENIPSRPAPKHLAPKYTLYSDASLAGWGAVLIRESDQHVFSTGAKWPDTLHGKHINTLEAIAALEGLSFFAHLIRGSSVELRIDNTSCAFAIRKGYARALYLNSIVAMLTDLAAMHNIFVSSVKYVRSAANVADAISRGYTIDEVAVQLTHKQITAWSLAKGDSWTGEGDSHGRKD